ncbi:hypothetical protein OZD66_00240, partial [Wolbachia endosymbiont of Drosophila baimaii]|nr:hypothetical protein [Wolbachia endosymbiont of Drosophila baimaii]
MYRLYQQLKDDAFCTAVAENNSVAATVLIQNDQERIAPRKSAVNKDETPVVTAPTIVTRKTNTTAPSVEENKTGLSNSNKNVGNKPMATVFPVSIAFLIIVRTGHRKAESTARRKDSNRGMF